MSTNVVRSRDASRGRLARERKTVIAMIRLYCRGVHGRRGGLCEECGELQAYAVTRLAKCPFGQDKPNCVRCPIHCYRPRMREQIRDVMRYAGWRMMYRHPLLAFWHMWDRRSEPEQDAEPKGNVR